MCTWKKELGSVLILSRKKPKLFLLLERFELLLTGCVQLNILYQIEDLLVQGRTP